MGAWFRNPIPLIHFFSLLSGGHSSLEPHLPIPNRTVKRVCADDSVPFAHAKVGYRQAIFRPGSPGLERAPGLFALGLIGLWSDSPARGHRPTVRPRGRYEDKTARGRTDHGRASARYPRRVPDLHLVPRQEHGG